MTDVCAILATVADFALVACGIGCLYWLFAAVLVASFRLRTSEIDCAPVPVTVLVPLCGHEPGLVHRLRALCRQNYAAPVQIICGALADSDPGLALAEGIATDDAGSAIECHADVRVHGPNLKVSNLINMMRHARYDILVMIDSDIEVGPDFISIMTATLRQPGVGAVTALYRGTSTNCLWARLAALSTNAYFLPSAILSLRLGLIRPCFGASIALSRATLRKLGGLRAFVGRLWDDYAIGAAIRDQGLRVAVSPHAISHVCCEKSAGELFAGQLRAARTAKGIAPWGHVGSVIAHPFALALIAVLVGGGVAALALAGGALICRVAAYQCFEYRFGGTARSYWLLPLSDLIAFAAFAASWFGTSVIWRGHRYCIVDAAPHLR
jgi:ceramide glucosyltransferase